MTNAEARFSNSLRPRKPEGSLGRTAQDGHLDSHTAPELWTTASEVTICLQVACNSGTQDPAILWTALITHLLAFWQARGYATDKGGLRSVNYPAFTSFSEREPEREREREREPHTLSIAFRYLPPNSARFSYATDGALFISAQLSSDSISALRKIRVLIWL